MGIRELSRAHETLSRYRKSLDLPIQAAVLFPVVGVHAFWNELAVKSPVVPEVLLVF